MTHGVEETTGRMRWVGRLHLQLSQAVNQVNRLAATSPLWTLVPLPELRPRKGSCCGCRVSSGFSGLPEGSLPTSELPCEESCFVQGQSVISDDQ